MQHSDESIQPQPEEAKPDRPVLIRGGNRTGADYHLGYADGMRETVILLGAVMLASIFLLVRFMDVKA